MQENLYELVKAIFAGKIFLTVFNMRDADINDIFKKIIELAELYECSKKINVLIDRMKELEKENKELKAKLGLITSKALRKKQYLDNLIKTMIHCNDPQVVKIVLKEIWRQLDSG